MNHKELTELALKWLKRPTNFKNRARSGPACSVAFTEVKAGFSGEIVDAIGFRTGTGMETILVEAKTSRADFLADRKKPHRNGTCAGVGNYRYYLCPEGLIKPEELPEGWGLLWVCGSRRVIEIQSGHLLVSMRETHPFWFESDRDAELALMTWLMVKIGDPEKQVNERKRLVREVSRLARLADQRDQDNRRLVIELNKHRNFV